MLNNNSYTLTLVLFDTLAAHFPLITRRPTFSLWQIYVSLSTHRHIRSHGSIWLYMGTCSLNVHLLRPLQSPRCISVWSLLDCMCHTLQAQTQYAAILQYSSQTELFNITHSWSHMTWTCTSLTNERQHGGNAAGLRHGYCLVGIADHRHQSPSCSDYQDWFSCIQYSW